MVMQMAAAHQLQANEIPLINHQALKSTNRDEACDFVGNIFCSHSLEPERRKPQLDFQMNHAAFGKGSSLNYLKYGTGIHIEAGEMRGVFNVQIQVNGTSRLSLGNQDCDIATGNAGVLSPGATVSMDMAPSSAMLIYSVRLATVEQVLRSLLNSDLDEPLIFEPVMDASNGDGGSFFRSLQFLQMELEQPRSTLNCSQVARHFEQCLIISMLYGHKHNYFAALSDSVSPAAPYHVRRAKEYIRVNFSEPILISDLAQAAGVSARTLFSGFRSFRGVSPMQYLRNFRLDQAHRSLSNALPDQSVTDIAFSVGFTQLGRFSGEYRRRFGESPSQTLRNSITQIN